MQKFICTVIVAISVTVFPPSSWADADLQAAQLERIELEIVRLKRELMDLERAYRFERNGADVEDVPEMTRQYALTSMKVSDALRRQEQIKMRLVEKSVNGYLAEENN